MRLPGPREWSGNQQVNATIFSVSAAIVQLLPYNADRVSLLLAASQLGSTSFITFAPRTTISQGMPLASTMGPVLLSFAQHGDLVKQPIYAAVASGTGSLYVVETVWLPGGD